MRNLNKSYKLISKVLTHNPTQIQTIKTNYQSVVLPHHQLLSLPLLLRLRRLTLQVVPHRKTLKTLICFSHSLISSFLVVIKLISRNSKTCQLQRVCCYQENSFIPSQIGAILKDIMIHLSKTNYWMQNIKFILLLLIILTFSLFLLLHSLIKE